MQKRPQLKVISVVIGKNKNFPDFLLSLKNNEVKVPPEIPSSSHPFFYVCAYKYIYTHICSVGPLSLENPNTPSDHTSRTSSIITS